jgi:hypothetical protein
MIKGLFDTFALSLPSRENVEDLAVFLFGTECVEVDYPTLFEELTLMDVLESMASSELSTISDVGFLKRFIRKVGAYRIHTTNELYAATKKILSEDSFRSVMALIAMYKDYSSENQNLGYPTAGN